MRFRFCKIDLLESRNEKIITELDHLSSQIPELEYKISTLELNNKQISMQVKVMEDKAKNLQFEKATIVEQINSAFTELTRLSSLLEEVKNNSRLRVAQLTEVSGVDDLGLGSGGDEDLIQQLIKENSIYMDLKKENVELKQKIMLLEDQLSLLQEHNHSFDKYLIREKEKISVLETEKGALNDVYQTSLNHQCTLSTQFSVLERKLRFMNQKFNALEVGNPKFAMSQLESHSSHMFVHACTRLVEKQQLLKEALGTANPDIIIFVVAYLHFSLPSDLFDAVVMAKEEASTYYLNYLKNCNPTLFKHVTMRNGKISELGMFYFETALTEQDLSKRSDLLKKCLNFCLKHPQETHLIRSDVEDSLNQTLFNLNTCTD
eukprot:TRINITY_DN1962_c0_g1_i7.p1 TRINITY_DN1962_c0_g1~~TRINITY_DN1962_c0_g1_i7.p1  ORF type:complete len:376 (-),score=93.46 TRINITY_DN1962_c0_g1_i7:157-1284(-)